MNPIRLPSAGCFGPPAALISGLPDGDLEARLKRLVGVERRVLAWMLAHLAEFDSRKLYADQGQPSLFAYCVHVLGYSEQGAYKRISAARAARNHPALFQHLAEGSIQLAAIVVLAPHLREENLEAMLASARGKTIRELEAMTTAWAPRPQTRDILRTLPHRDMFDERHGATVAGLHPPSAISALPHAAVAAAPELQQSLQTQTMEVGAAPPPGMTRPRERLKPLSAERFLFHFTAGAGLRADFMRATDLLRTRPHGVSGSMEKVFQAALGALLDRLDPERRDARRRRKAESREARRRHKSTASRFSSRRIARPLRDAVWTRDGGRCAFMGPGGQRCTATRYLEIDHVHPYALGGRSDDQSNLRLMCRAHNQLLARRAFGKAASRASKAV